MVMVMTMVMIVRVRVGVLHSGLRTNGSTHELTASASAGIMAGGQ
jgi:hypothetical protein